MKVFFWSCLLLLIPGMLLRIPIEGAGILATDIILPVFACVWLFQKLVVQRKFPHNSFLLSAVIFLLIATLSFLFATPELFFKEQVLSFAHLLRLFSILVFGWSAIDIFQMDYRPFFTKIFWISAVVIILGYIQFILVPDISTWSTEGGWDPHTGRLLGTWMDPNFMAGFLGFFLPLVFAQWYQTTSKKRKFWLFVLAFLALGALFLTFSRSGYVSAVMGLFIFFVLRDPKMLLVGILVLALGIVSNERALKRTSELAGTISALVFLETDEIDPTASLRLANWRKSIDLWEKYPVIGIGYNTYRYRASEEGVVDESYFSSGGSDSTHLTVLVTTGILGFLAYIFFLGTLWLTNLKRFFKTRNELFLGFVAGFTALLIHACFVNSLFFPFIFLPLIATAGVLETIPVSHKR